MLRSVFVDLGETLVGFRPRTFELISTALKDYGYSFDPLQVYRTMMKVMAKYNYPDEQGSNPFDMKEFMYELGIVSKDMIEKVQERVKYGDSHFIYDDAIPFLEGVKSMGLTTVLVSNATPRAREIVREYGLDKYLDNLIFSCDVGLIKPNPRIFSLAMKIGGFPAVHVGDIYEMDVIGAKRAFVTPLLLDRFGLYPDAKEVKRVSNLNDALKEIQKMIETEEIQKVRTVESL
ncbi:HAD family hydrolase [Sulfuracidifex metallicus]|uniref:HAD family hydrolase n=1 Tax=Sulfuracidifex metallicus TaxID=47303 RepID=UPI0022724CB9|nr:HAD family hydrolase [Sulfuracidifex metallicus]MCY0849801.1 HAD hydrolase-like protein [Sulfuracidifex metallicus]